MRPRFAVSFCARTLVVSAAPGVASARPTTTADDDQRHRTINAGDSVLITVSSTARRSPAKDRLFHHISGFGSGFTPIGSTTTDSRLLRGRPES
jgi:hypothetical protein